MKVCFGRTLNSTDFSSDKALYINNAGYFDNPQMELNVKRIDGRRDFQLLCITAGKLTMFNEGSEEILESGDVYIYPPDTPQCYSARESDNTKFFWVHFSGYDVIELLENCGIDTKVIYHDISNSLIESNIKRIVSVLQARHSCYELDCIGIFLSFLAQISNCRNHKKTDSMDKIRNARIKMENEFTMNFSIDKYAAYCGLSKSHFIRAFHNEYGISPKKYITNLRVSHAKELLIHTDISIGNISRMCGYNDPLYFSRVFGKNVGISPKAYRG